MFFKRINFIILSWIIDALAKDESDLRESKIDFAVGGQAVIEGVMMRSPNSITIATRKTDGSIKVKEDHYQNITYKHRWLNLPILRGVINLFEMMVIGSKAINYSANESLDLEQNGSDSKKLNKILEYGLFSLSLIAALAFSIFLFKFLPLAIATLFSKYFSAVNNNYIFFNLIDGAFKTIIFLAYIFLLTLMPSFRRIFEYHGAEHKSIFTYESEKELIPENAKTMSRFHPRCGTSFIIIVFLFSIIVYTIFPKMDSFAQNLILRVALLPLIAGISYEYLKFSAKHSKQTLVKALIAPGLWFQRLTTKEPDQKQLEVGLHSLQAALNMEGKNK